jgi:steroid Delta-isomerase
MLALTAVAVGAVAWLRWRPFAVTVQGESMAPTLRPGELLVAVRPGRIRRGALVVVEHPDRAGYEMVKRVAGLPGDRVEGGVLGPHQYWMAGDSIERSTDSRSFGPVGGAHLKGAVLARYWPLGRVSITLSSARRGSEGGNPMAAGEALFGSHVERFNQGVRTGDFGPMVEAFAQDAELVFEGVPVGPFVGREAIAAAYRHQPPDDEIEVLDVAEGKDGDVVARYAWRKEAGITAGEMRLSHDGHQITRLVVTFDPKAGPVSPEGRALS